MKRVSVDASVTDLICQLTLPDIVLNWGAEDRKGPLPILHFLSDMSASG